MVAIIAIVVIVLAFDEDFLFLGCAHSTKAKDKAQVAVSRFTSWSDRWGPGV